MNPKKLKTEYDVNRMISWFNESYGNEEPPDDLVSLDASSARGGGQKEGWSKKELIETRERKEFR